MMSLLDVYICVCGCAVDLYRWLPFLYVFNVLFRDQCVLKRNITYQPSASGGGPDSGDSLLFVYIGRTHAKDPLIQLKSNYVHEYVVLTRNHTNETRALFFLASHGILCLSRLCSNTTTITTNFRNKKQ